MSNKKSRRSLWLANTIDNIITRGFSTLILVLLVISLVVVLIAGAGYVIFSPDKEMSIIEALWTAFGYTSSPQLPPYADVSSVAAFAVITFLVIIAGLLVTSSLIGIITNALSDYYESLQRGYSPVVEEGHFVIIGFNDTVAIHVDELTKGFDDREGWCLVFIDGTLDRKSMEQRLENFVGMPLKKFQKAHNCRLICRCGDPHNIEDLRRYAVDRAKAIIINDFEDPIILKDLLAVSSLLRSSENADDPSKQPAIVCTFREEQYAAAARCMGNEENLRVMSLSSTLANMVAKTCYQPGLSRIISDLYDFDGSEFYMKDFPAVTGMHFDGLITLFGSSIPIGICRPFSGGCGVEIIINRPNIDTASLTKAMYDAQMTVREGDKIIFLATDRNELAWAQSADIQVSDDYTCRKYFSKREANRILVLGYDEAFDSTVVALEEHYSKTATGPDDINCSIKLVYRKKRENRVRSARLKFLDSEFIRGKHGVELEQSHGADSEMKRIKDIQIGTTQISFQCARQDYFDIHILESILFSGEQYDHIVVLSDLSAAKEDADTETLLTLLYLRAISENAKKGVYAGVELAPFNITSEIQNMENVNLAYNEYVSDYIISWKFIASLQVQIAVDKNLYKILRDILKSGHADVRLEPVTHFVKPGFFDNGDMSALKDDIGALADAPVAGTPKAVAATPAAVAAHDVCVPVDLDAIAYKMRTIDDISEKRLLLGYTHGDDDYVLNPSRDENGRRVALLSQDDQLIVLANDL